MLKRLTPALALAVLVAPVAAADRPAPDISVRIRQEEDAHSQIMRTLHFLTDVYGPRLTGTPSLKAAGEWAVKTMESWGFANGHLEPWSFGHQGWTNDHVTAHIVSPMKTQLSVEVLAWTPGTDGTVTAPAYQMSLPERPTPEELTAFLDGQKDRVRGRIVLVGRPVVVPVDFDPPPKRRDDAQVRGQYDPNSPTAGQFFPRPRPGPPPPMTAAQVDERVNDFLVANGATLRVNDAGRAHGQIIAFNNRTYDLARAVPTVVMRNEDYGRISRVLADGTAVELEFNIVNRVYPEGHDRVQHDRRDSRNGQEGRGRDARRPPRFVAFRDRRDRQRDRLRDDDGGGADPRGARRPSRAGRSASRCGAGKRRGCSGRRRTSSSTSDRSSIRSPNSPPSPAT